MYYINTSALTKEIDNEVCNCSLRFKHPFTDIIKSLDSIIAFRINLKNSNSASV